MAKCTHAIHSSGSKELVTSRLPSAKYDGEINTATAARTRAKVRPPISRVIKPVTTTTAEIATAGKNLIAQSESPSTIRLTLARNGTSGGWSTYPNAR